MSSDGDVDQTRGVLNMAVGGIQDVSALLPLLGTEQCEALVPLALERGRLYAAAGPMSIFGSLGIVKAGLVVLWGTISNSRFHGPTPLQNAGFTLPGVGALLADSMQGDSHRRSLAEERIRCYFLKKRIISVDVNFSSKDFLEWNTYLLVETLACSSLGLLPYVYLIVRHLSGQPFGRTWLYPTMRTVGCALVSVTIQYVFQLRLLEEAYSRIRFIAMDSYLKENEILLPSFWDSSARSRRVLDQVKEVIGSQRLEAHPCFNDLGTMSSFNYPLPDATAKPAIFFTSLEDKMAPEPDTSQMPRKGRLAIHCARIADRFTEYTGSVFFMHVAMAFGIGLSVVGYIGCFSVVQASPREDSRGALIWLLGEALLAIARIFLWAWNPLWDDPTCPIALKRVRVKKDGGGGDGDDVLKGSSGVAWTLDSAIVEDMRALIIDASGGSRTDTSSVMDFLRNTLTMSKKQIVSLVGSDVTKKKVVENLRHLGVPRTRQGPIIIFFAAHGFQDQSQRLHFNCRCDAREVYPEDVLSYDELSEILKQVSDKPGEITLILDIRQVPQPRKAQSGKTQDKAQADTYDLEAGVNVQETGTGFKPIASKLPVAAELLEDQSSYVVLAGITVLPHQGHEMKAPFTDLLTEALTAAATPDEFRTMRWSHRVVLELHLLLYGTPPVTYRDVVKWIHHRHNLHGTELGVMCSTMYEDHLLFGGILARKPDSKPLITVQYQDVRIAAVDNPDTPTKPTAFVSVPTSIQPSRVSHSLTM